MNVYATLTWSLACLFAFSLSISSRPLVSHSLSTCTMHARGGCGTLDLLPQGCKEQLAAGHRVYEQIQQAQSRQKLLEVHKDQCMMLAEGLQRKSMTPSSAAQAHWQVCLEGREGKRTAGWVPTSPPAMPAISSLANWWLGGLPSAACCRQSMETAADFAQPAGTAQDKGCGLLMAQLPCQAGDKVKRSRRQQRQRRGVELHVQAHGCLGPSTHALLILSAIQEGWK